MGTQQQLLDDVVVSSSRRTLDFYQTPRWMTEALLRRLALPSWVHILEPAAGDLAIVRVLNAHGFSNVSTNDIDTDRVTEHHLDATQPVLWRRVRPMVTIANPPFNGTFPMLQHALDCTEGLTAMLQRASFDEPTIERGPWFKTHRPTLRLVMPRWNFRTVNGKGGNDNVPPCWFVWASERAWCLEVGTDYVIRDERNQLIAESKWERHGDSSE